MTSSIPIASTIAPSLSASTGATVELSGVVKNYGTHRALNSIDLSIKPGEFVALLGPSGCGKTTALRALSGLELIDGGRIIIDGDDVAGVPTNKRDIGMVFQSYSLFPHLTVIENVEFGLRMRRVSAGERRGRGIEALDMVGLASFAERFAHQLSGGQQQRVALARALVTRPRVLLLDEPLSALDAKVRVQLRDEIRRIQTELGITTVFVTHDQEEALAVADRVAVMREGVIEQIGTPEELYSAPSTPFVADFVGLSNRIPAELVGGRVIAHGASMALLGEQMADGLVTALVRPENVEIVSSGFPATVVSSSFLGSLRRTQVILSDDSVLSIQHRVDLRPQQGDSVFLRLTASPVSAVRRTK
jgi:putative spermidine/putrescine transport system ATP-binding protein